MEEGLKDIKPQNENKNNIINIEEIVNISFENQKEINNFFFNIILEKKDENENENENDNNIINENNNHNDNDNNYCDEDSKEENSIFKSLLDDLNGNIELNLKDEINNCKECQEILDILKYPHSDKNIRGGISPFKPLLRPKKISLIGRVFYDIPDDENNNTTTENTTLNDHNNGKMLNGNI